MRGSFSLIFVIAVIGASVAAIVLLFPRKPDLRVEATAVSAAAIPTAVSTSAIASNAEQPAHETPLEAKREQATEIRRGVGASRAKSAAEPEKCDKRGMKIHPPGMAAISSEYTCCAGRSPRIGMTLQELEATCWPKPIDERRYTSSSGTALIRVYSVQTVNGQRKELTFFNGVLRSIYEGL